MIVMVIITIMTIIGVNNSHFVSYVVSRLIELLNNNNNYK